MTVSNDCKQTNCVASEMERGKGGNRERNRLETEGGREERKSGRKRVEREAGDAERRRGREEERRWRDRRESGEVERGCRNRGWGVSQWGGGGC